MTESVSSVSIRARAVMSLHTLFLLLSLFPPPFPLHWRKWHSDTVTYKEQLNHNESRLQLHIRSNWAIMKVGSRKRCKGPRSLRKDAWHHYREGNAKQNFSVALRVVVRAWGSGGIVGSYFMGRVSVLQDGKSSGDVLYNHRTVTVLNCTCKNGLRQQILCILYHN